mmetsp:Transcript_14304/g.27291  ORF Transcript_14304/g.27291 Transcript_14304/m.27291 type:complete len:305 (-) Transcript_14304:963-1877(-)
MDTGDVGRGLAHGPNVSVTARLDQSVGLREGKSKHFGCLTGKFARDDVKIPTVIIIIVVVVVVVAVVVFQYNNQATTTTTKQSHASLFLDRQGRVIHIRLGRIVGLGFGANRRHRHHRGHFLWVFVHRLENSNGGRIRGRRVKRRGSSRSDGCDRHWRNRQVASNIWRVTCDKRGRGERNHCVVDSVRSVRVVDRRGGNQRVTSSVWSDIRDGRGCGERRRNGRVVHSNLSDGGGDNQRRNRRGVHSNLLGSDGGWDRQKGDNRGVEACLFEGARAVVELIRAFDRVVHSFFVLCDVVVRHHAE